MIGVQQIYATKTFKYVYKKCMENIKVHMKTRTFTGNKTIRAIYTIAVHIHISILLKNSFPDINNNLKNRLIRFSKLYMYRYLETFTSS